MKEQEWLEKYIPIHDELNDTNLWDTKDPILKAVKSNHVWTLCDEGGDEYIIAGFHYVNRLGYYITEVPWEDELMSIECESEDEGYICEICDEDIPHGKYFSCDNCGAILCDQHSFEDKDDHNRILCGECLEEVRSCRDMERDIDDGQR